MEMPEFSQPMVTGRGTKLEAVHGGDEGLIVQFYMESVKQGAESEKAGRPIFKDVPFIWIRFPGDRTREVKKRATSEWRNRFPREWAAFERQQEQGFEGTPVEEWGPMSRSLALTYKGMNVFTVEQLAQVPDSALPNMGHGARELRDKAIAWLKAAEDSSEIQKYAAENQHLKDEIDALKQQVAELGKRKPRARKTEG